MSDLQCSSAALRTLLTIYSVGLQLGTRAELEELLGALRLLHPQQWVVDLCEVRLLFIEQRWTDALHLLRRIDAQGYGSPVIAALEGFCLHVLGDSDWRRCVASVLESGHPTGIAIAGKFLKVNGEPSAERVAERLGEDWR